MTIKALKSELEESQNPVAKSLHRNHAFRVLTIGFKKGMVLKAHVAKWPSKLTVLEGAVTYIQGNENTKLHQYDEFDIPVGIVHEVIADSDSLCLLTQDGA